MKTLSTCLAAGALAIGGPAIAQVNEPAPDYKVAPQVEVIERTDRGMASMVRVGDTIYPVCMSDGQDSCIQPRAAGLGFGERPLSYWPGQ